MKLFITRSFLKIYAYQRIAQISLCLLFIHTAQASELSECAITCDKDAVIAYLENEDDRSFNDGLTILQKLRQAARKPMNNAQADILTRLRYRTEDYRKKPVWLVEEYVGLASSETVGQLSDLTRATYISLPPRLQRRIVQLDCDEKMQCVAIREATSLSECGLVGVIALEDEKREPAYYTLSRGASAAVLARENAADIVFQTPAKSDIVCVTASLREDQQWPWIRDNQYIKECPNVCALAWSRNGQRVATAELSELDKTFFVKIWEPLRGTQLIAQVRTNQPVVTALLLDGLGSQVLYRSRCDKIYIYPVREQQADHITQPSHVIEVPSDLGITPSWSSDGSVIAVPMTQHQIRLYSRKQSRAYQPSFQMDFPYRSITALWLNENATWLAFVSAERRLTLLDLNAPTTFSTLPFDSQLIVYKVWEKSGWGVYNYERPLPLDFLSTLLIEQLPDRQRRAIFTTMPYIKLHSAHSRSSLSQDRKKSQGNQSARVSLGEGMTAQDLDEAERVTPASSRRCPCSGCVIA